VRREKADKIGAMKYLNCKLMNAKGDSIKRFVDQKPMKAVGSFERISILEIDWIARGEFGFCMFQGFVDWMG
jgi:hypothetical protein